MILSFQHTASLTQLFQISMSHKSSIIESLERREKALRKDKERIRQLEARLYDSKEAESLLREEDHLLESITKSRHPSSSTFAGGSTRNRPSMSIEAEIIVLQETASAAREKPCRSSSFRGAGDKPRSKRGHKKSHSK